MLFFIILLILSVTGWVGHDIWVGKFSDSGPVDVAHSIPLSGLRPVDVEGGRQ